jgi:hypothetical protein
MPTLTANNQTDIIKCSATIAISNALSLFERKLWNHLLAHAFMSPKDSSVFSVALATLKEKMGFDSKNIEYLKNALRNLVKTVVEFNILGKDKSNW